METTLSEMYGRRIAFDQKHRVAMTLLKIRWRMAAGNIKQLANEAALRMGLPVADVAESEVDKQTDEQQMELFSESAS